MRTIPIYITADDYASVINAIFGDTPKDQICTRLGISRPTHNAWLKHGVKSAKHAKALRDLAGQTVTALRARARHLDRFTTQ